MSSHKKPLIHRAADRLRPTRIIRNEMMLDLRFAAALLLLVAAKILIALMSVLGVAALIVAAVLALTGLTIWCWRPTVPRAYIPFEHYEWDERVWLPRPAGPPVLRYRWDAAAAEPLRGDEDEFDCLRCARRVKRPGHLEVTRCRCGTVYGVAGAGLYVRWARGRRPQDQERVWKLN